MAVRPAGWRSAESEVIIRHMYTDFMREKRSSKVLAGPYTLMAPDMILRNARRAGWRASVFAGMGMRMGVRMGVIMLMGMFVAVLVRVSMLMGMPVPALVFMIVFMIVLRCMIVMKMMRGQVGDLVHHQPQRQPARGCGGAAVLEFRGDPHRPVRQ